MMNDRLRPGYSYYTFDVFDTVLVRKWARPQDLFFELGSILLGEGGTDIGPERFMQLRILAEKKARRGRKNGEIAIPDIYRVLSRDIGLDASWEKKAMQMEIGLEKRSVYPVPGVKIAIDDIRKTGKKIYYISDMYLPSGIIIDMLKENKLWDAGDRIFV
jgi:predicted HAD superfamily hydrolase